MDKHRKIFCIWKNVWISFVKNKIPKNIRILNSYRCGKINYYNALTNLEKLTVYKSKSFVGDNLSRNLKELEVYYCKSFIGNNLPEDLEVLLVYSYSGPFIGDNLPITLKHLTVYDGVGVFVGDKLPIKLETLKLIGCGAFKPNYVPKTLRTIHRNGKLIYEKKNFNKKKMKVVIFFFFLVSFCYGVNFLISKNKTLVYKNRFSKDKFHLRINAFSNNVKFNLYFLNRHNKRFSWSGTYIDKEFRVYVGEWYIFEYSTYANKTLEVGISLKAESVNWFELGSWYCWFGFVFFIMCCLFLGLGILCVICFLFDYVCKKHNYFKKVPKRDTSVNNHESEYVNLVK